MKYLLEFNQEIYKGLYVTPIILDKTYNRFFNMYDKSIRKSITDLCNFINDKYSDVLVVKMKRNIQPGLITKKESNIQHIAKDIYDFLNQRGVDNRVVYGEGLVSDLDNDIHQCYGDLLVKIGRKTDSLSGKVGIFKASHIILKHREITENMDLKLKDILVIKNDLLDIFNICKNEIKLSNNDVLYISLYTKIMQDCLLEYYGLTNGEVKFIDKAKETLTFSKNEIEAKRQYKEITNPKNEFSAYLLKILTDYKNKDILEEFSKLVQWKLTGEIRYPEYLLRRILNKKVYDN
jgi:hypothetical protein